MANSHRGEVDLVANEKTYTLKMDTRAISLAEDAESDGIGALLEEVEKSNKVGVMVTLLWASLQRHHKGITVEQVQDIVDEVGIKAVTSVLATAFERSVLAKEAPTGNAPPPRAEAAA